MDPSGAPSAEQLPARSNGCRTCLLVGLVLLAMAYLGLRALGAFLITGDRLEPADAVVVLGGGGEHRVEEAVRLMRERYGMWLVVTEPGETEPGGGMGSQIFRQVAINNGLSPDVILITEKTAASTYQEAIAVLHTMEKHDLKSVIVVTDPFHTQRTRMIFHQIFDGTGRTARVHPVPGHWYRSSTWFLSREGWGHTIREYVKMIGFWVGYYETMD